MAMTQPPAKDRYAKVADLYKRALAEADKAENPDEYRARAQAAYDKKIRQIAEEESAPRQPAPADQGIEPVREPMGPAKAIGTAMASGLPLVPSLAGAAGAALRRKPNESFGQAYSREMAGLGEMERQAKEELAPGMGTALQMATGLATFPLISKIPGVQQTIGARVAPDAARLAKSLAAGKRVAGGAALAGAESASRQGMEEGQLSPGEAAGIAAGLGVVGESIVPGAKMLGQVVSNLPIGIGPFLVSAAKGAVKPAQELTTQARRSIADYLAPQGGLASRAAAAIEPTDVTRIQRTVQSTLPARGETVEQITRQAALAEDRRKALGEAVGEAESAIAKFGEKGERAATRAVEQAGARAKQTAEATVAEIERQAQQQFGSLTNPAQSGAALRKVVVERMDRLGKQVYPAVQAVKPLAEPPRRIYQQIDKSSDLSSAFQFAEATKRARLFGENVGGAIAEGADITKTVKPERLEKYVLGQARNPATGEMVDVKRTKVDLEMFDYMRRWVSDKVEAGLTGNAEGITRSKAAALNKQINAMERDFLGAYSGAERKALETARNTMRDQFENLELISNGFNLGRFSLNAPPEMREAGAKDLAELVKEVAALPKAKRKYFEIPARQSIANLIQQSDRSIESIAGALVGTTEARKRTALALGPELTATLERYLPSRITAAGEAAAAPVAARGVARAKRVEQITEKGLLKRRQEAEQLAAQLAAQKNRAEQLGVLAETAQSGVAALGDFTAGRGFAATLPQSLGGAGRQTVAGTMAGVLQDQLRDLSPQDAIAKLMEYQKNPAARAMFGPELDRAIAQLRPRASVIPSLRTYLTGQAVGRQ